MVAADILKFQLLILPLLTRELQESFNSSAAQKPPFSMTSLETTEDGKNLMVPPLSWEFLFYKGVSHKFYH